MAHTKTKSYAPEQLKKKLVWLSGDSPATPYYCGPLQPQQLAPNTWPSKAFRSFAQPCKSGSESLFGGNKCWAEPEPEALPCLVTLPCVKFTALFSQGGLCKAGGVAAEPGSPIYPQERAAGTREVCFTWTHPSGHPRASVVPGRLRRRAGVPSGPRGAAPGKEVLPGKSRASCSGREEARSGTDRSHWNVQ